MDIDFADQLDDVFLEVEVSPSNAYQFEQDYFSVAGEYPVIGAGYQHQPNKWGKELRVYFNTNADLVDEFSSINVYVEHGRRSYRSRWTYRTNDADFFWGLVRAGYRLGEN